MQNNSVQGKITFVPCFSPMVWINNQFFPHGMNQQSIDFGIHPTQVTSMNKIWWQEFLITNIENAHHWRSLSVQWKGSACILLQKSFCGGVGFGIFPTYTPLSVKICFLLWKFQLKIFIIFKISEKKFLNLGFFPKFPTPQRGRQWHQRGRRLLTSKLPNFHFQLRIAIARGI